MKLNFKKIAKRHVRVKTLINMTFKHFKIQLEKDFTNTKERNGKQSTLFTKDTNVINSI